MKRTIVWLGLLFLLFSSSAGAEAAQTLLRNGDMEAGAGVVPSDWTADVYLPNNDNQVISTLTWQNDGGHSGTRYLRVSSSQPNDARWVERVTVKPDTVYKLSGWIRVLALDNTQTGANLSVLGTGDIASDVREANNQWTQVEVYGRTGASQTEITVAARLGGYGGLNTGTADFDDISLEPVSDVPSGATVLSWSASAPSSGADASSAVPNHRSYKFAMILIGFLYALLAVWVVRYLRRQPSPALEASGDRWRMPSYAIMLFAGALLLRILLAAWTPGHPVDALCFFAWSNHAYSAGLHGFYTADMFVDYPPGYIYVLYIAGMIQHLFGLEYQSAGSIIVLKLPSMIADVLGAYLLFRLARARTGDLVATALASLYLFNPMVFHNSVIWGQIDSFLTLFLVLAVYLLVKGRLSAAAASIVVAILIKPQAVLLLPVLFFALVRSRSKKIWIETLLYSIAAFVLLVLPFSINQDPSWIVEKYKAMFESYPYATLNAANLFGLMGDNGVKITSSMAVWSNVAVVLIIALIGYLAYRYRSKGLSIYALLALLTNVLIFVFKTSMHERYGYPTVLLAMLAYVLLKDRRLLWISFALTFTHFTDVAYVFQLSLDKNYYLPAHDGWFRFLSLCNIGIAAYTVYVSCTLDRAKDLFRPAELASTASGNRNLMKSSSRSPGSSKSTTSKGGNTQSNSKRPFISPASLAEKASKRLSRRDAILLSGLTLVYAVIALVNLGSMKNPETSWHPQAAGSALVYDFGKPVSVSNVMWYGGIGDGKLELSQSADGQQYTSAMNMELNGGSVFQWKTQPVAFTAQYVKLTSDSPAVTLYELAFRDAEGKTLQPVHVDQPDGSALIDEPKAVPDKPSYMNSMYFDEIYHARTGYEFLHHIEPYETTHPPLGKVFISLGITLFGMNPFGWRIIGTLLGIGMIPILYLLAKRLFGRTKYAFAAAFLLAFDFMHFTQSRIATVDVYGVFFILLMYYFMYQFYVRCLNKETFKATAAPLAWAGIFFGLGAASKWIDIYAGGGLAVILAIALYQRWKEHQYFWRIIAWCGVFFLIIPAAIYTASYIPFFLVPGKGHDLHAMITYQSFMFNYHAHLVATHPFASSWWQWPLMVKPIWYYAGAVPVGKLSSIVAFGNPAVWWIGSAAALGALLLRLRVRDPRLTFLLIGLAAQYLPWVGVERLTFIYHFFASVPFLILLTVYLIQYASKNVPGWSRGILYGYLGVTFVLFVLFYPILSGMTVSASYVTHTLKWFSSWYFGA